LNNFEVRLELEDRLFLASRPHVEAGLYASFARPAEVTLDDIKHENQGAMGSCQGNEITSCVERLLNVAGKHKGIQLSRIYAYLASQKLDNLLGSDRGSTISSGVKVALKGIPPEARVPYPNPVQYPNRTKQRNILASFEEEDREYSAISTWKVPHDVDLCMDFVGGGGAISVGISWYKGIIPRDRIVRQFRPPRNSGGHAIAFLGYTVDGLLRFMNSHGDGGFFVTPQAWLMMLTHQWTAAVGLLGTNEPEPVDWLNDSPLFN
jgi:hypothetical protein